MAQNSTASKRVSLWPWVYVIALVYFALHLATSTRYGYFRDALYYLACSEHLAFGYVDQPPLIALLGWIARHTLGTSLPALLFWPALAGAARIVLTAAFARELGAGRFGTLLAAALAATPGVWWVIDHQFAMNCLEPLFWGGLAFVVLRLINTGNPKLWLVFGAIAGVGLQNKYSIIFFASALTRRSSVDAPAPIAVYAVDSRGRRDRISDIPAKPDLEYSKQLAVPRVDAERARHRKRRSPAARPISLAADPDDEPSEFSVLVRRSSLPVVFTRREELSRARMDLRDHDRVLHDHAWKGLLLRTCIRDVVCRRRSRD